VKIILIAVDTLRADHLGCYGYPLETSPRIDHLAQEGALFLNHYSTDVPTPPAYTAMFCAQRGLRNGIFGFRQTNYDFTTMTPLLAEHLAGAGYRTGMISNLLYPCPWLVRGFRDIVPPGLRFQGGRADEVTDEACRWLDQHGREDFFLFVHYWDPHVPYFRRAPQRYKDQFLEEDYSGIAHSTDMLERNPVVNVHYRSRLQNGKYDWAEVLPAYDACIRYADEGIERLLDYLDTLGISEEVLLIFTSDHGEAFGEKGFFDHLGCYENICHVPLIVKWTGRIPPNSRIEGYTLCVDLMPTILEACGLPVPEGLCGKSLSTTWDGHGGPLHREVVSNGASIPIQRMYIKDGWALVHTLDKSVYTYLNTYELFRLDEDRAQEMDLAGSERAKFQEMRSGLDQWMDRELQGRPDLLQGLVLRGGGWYGVERTLLQHPEFLSEDGYMRDLLFSRLGMSGAQQRVKDVVMSRLVLAAEKEQDA
jgi:arylsulfatase